MSVSNIAVGQLSDGRLQLFAWGGEGEGRLWSCWKTGADVHADYFEWTKWTPFDQSSFLSLVPQTAARQGNGSLQLFFLAQQPYVQGGPDVATTWKVDAKDPNSAWAPWQTFYKAQYGSNGGTGVVSVACAPLPDGRLQIFMMEVPGQLQTAWQESVGGSWVDARPMPQPPEALNVLTAAPLSDKRIQLWGLGTQDLWTTWKVGADAGAEWYEWTKFQSINSTISFYPPTALTVGRHADGRLQLWASAGKTDGSTWQVLTCVKTSSTDSTSLWTPWEQFLETEELIEQGIQQLTVAPLSDGRLQLWGIDGIANLFTTWQLTKNSSDWNPWTTFPTP